jgi:hypothetical protein
MNEAQTNKQHPIPQNFMDVEFKIVGDFTVRQFTYLCATGLPMYFIFNSPIQSFIKSILLVFLGILGFLLVFVPIDDRGMDVWIVNFFKSVYGINRRVWRKTPIIPKTLSMETLKLVQGEMITLAPTSSRRKLEEYLKGIKVEEADEYDFNFKKHKFNDLEPIPTQTSIAEQVTPKLEPFDLEKEIRTGINSLPKPEGLKKPVIEEVVIKIPQIKKETTEITPVVKEPIHKEIFKKISQPVRSLPSSLKEAIKPKQKTQVTSDIHEELRTSSTDVPGRKFVSFSSKEQDIILPIRGEKTINIFQQQPKESIGTGSRDIKTLTKELRTLVREIKNEEPNIVNQPIQTEIIEENKISGICFDQTNKPLTNILLTLLDSNDKELQYSRTDNLGKFTFNNTPLGDFKIKVLNPELYSLNFDIIKFSVSKYPHTLIQIIGKK